MNKSKKENIVVIWSDGFPFKLSASNEKNKLIAKAIINEVNNVLLLSKGFAPNNESDYGVYDNIPYKFLLKRKQLKAMMILKSFSMELLLLYNFKKKYKKVVLVASYCPFLYYLIIALFSRLLHYKLVLNIMEWHIAQHKQAGIIKKVNAYLFDKSASFFSHGSFTICDFIKEKLAAQKRNTKMLVVPALANIVEIDKIKVNNLKASPYILYCGNTGYLEVIYLIIDSFANYIQNQKDEILQLKLILNGNVKIIEKLRQELINRGLNNRIFIIYEIPYKKLIEYYKSSTLLLIPLRNTDQDKARYPQKIAEYAACGIPIISNCIGQVGKDFTHAENIYFASDFSVIAYEEAINTLMNDKVFRVKLGSNARDLSFKYFDYLIYKNVIHQFIQQL